jgi:hypothetical protein
VTAPSSLLRWSSPTSPSVRAAELNVDATELGQLTNALDSISPRELIGAPFLVVRLGKLRAADIQAALATLSRIDSIPRICLALDRHALRELDTAAIDRARIGLMIDEVDADTPLSLIAFEILEAVRFRGEFVQRASRDLRLECALDAMLAFAKDLGLCTLGPAMASNEASFNEGVEFDYVAVRAPVTTANSRTERGNDPSTGVWLTRSRT